MGGPALFLRHTSANAWDNAFINFDHTGWFPAPNYVIMKLWRENFAPKMIHSTCNDIDINLVATLSEDGKTAFCKLVNPVDEEKEIHIQLPGNIGRSEVNLQIVAPDSLHQRNTMENPQSIVPLAGKTKVVAQAITFEMPAYSCGVVKMRIR